VGKAKANDAVRDELHIALRKEGNKAKKEEEKRKC
jgi:hypothetical protein